MPLDLESIHEELLIPELAKLLLALRFELIRGDNDVELEYNESMSMVVSYSLFCFLVRRQALRIRDNRAGHSFIIPDSKLQEQKQINDLICQGVPAEVIQDAIRTDKSFRVETHQERLERENEYKPRITKLAQEQSGEVSRSRRGVPVEEILLLKGKRSKENLAQARERVQSAERKVCTFHPRFYKPPPELAHIKKRIDDSPVDPNPNPITINGSANNKVIPKSVSVTSNSQPKQDNDNPLPTPPIPVKEDSIISENSDNLQAVQESKVSKDGRDETNSSHTHANTETKDYSHPFLVASGQPAPPLPPLPAEVSLGIPISSAEKKKQQNVAHQLAKELFDSSPRDPFKS